MWPEPGSRSVRLGDREWVNAVKGTRRHHVVCGTLQDALNKHDLVVTLTSQPRPQGASAGPLNLFRYLEADLPYFKLNQCPTGDLLYCCAATTQPLNHTKALYC